MKTIFIVNPTSGNGDGKLMLPIIEEVMKEELLPYECIVTQYPMHAREIAGSYRQNDDVRLISVGGDGTINEVLNGINVGVPLGIIPCGSGNDFFRMITTKKIDRKQLIVDTIHGSVLPVDYGIMNGRKFLNSFSIGIDATIARKAKVLQAKSKLDLKAGAYMIEALKEIIHPQAMHVTLELAGQTITSDALLISSLNGKWYGGGFMPAPDANIQDGLFDVSVIAFLNTWKIIPLFTKYMKGTHGTAKAVTMLKANRFTLHTEHPVEGQIDGELFMAKRFELEVVHRGLSLIVPKGDYDEIRK